ncbi:MAG: RnfABCDGE type electron transport complex subunit D [Planctomycetota bacterium]
MTGLAKTLDIRSSPHILSGDSVERIMRHVVVGLVPVVLFSVWAFGLSALLTLSAAVLSSVLTEHLLCKAGRKETTIGDASAVVTGLLYGLTLPPSLPLWMTSAGGAICIAVGKAAFGGLGSNPFNPALVGRAILQAAFPVAMTTWTAPFAGNRFLHCDGSLLTFPFLSPVYDGTSGPTPLSAFKFGSPPRVEEFADLLLGTTTGSIGETCAVLILLGGLYLALLKMLEWRIPVAILSTVALLSWVLHLVDGVRFAGPLFHLGSGGLMLGAVFMATDMVGSPMTKLGSVVFGVAVGALVVVIRTFGAMPEGVMYAILLGNALVPHIDALIQPRVYGTRASRGGVR